VSSTLELLNEIADLHEAMARTLRAHAAQLPDRDDHGEPEAEKDLRPQQEVDDVIARARVVHPSLGERQEQILRLVANAHPAGITTGEIWRPINYDQTNVYLTLQALGRQKLVRRDVNVRPYRYYLGPKLADQT
jgi:hypothetical protein